MPAGLVAPEIVQVGIVQGIDRIGEKPGQHQRDQQLDHCHLIAAARRGQLARDCGHHHQRQQGGNHHDQRAVGIVLLRMAAHFGHREAAQQRQQREQENPGAQVKAHGQGILPGRCRIEPVPQRGAKRQQQGKGDETGRGQPVTKCCGWPSHLTSPSRRSCPAAAWASAAGPVRPLPCPVRPVRATASADRPCNRSCR